MESTLVDIAINVFYAKNVPKADATGLSDPYVIISYNSMTDKGLKKKKKKTATKKETLSPTWNESFILKSVAPESIISFNAFDWDNALKFGSDDFLGRFSLFAERIPTNKRYCWHVPLNDNLKSAGELMFITYAVPSVSKAYDIKKNKELLLKNVAPVTEDIDVPLFVCRYDHRLDVDIRRTENFLGDKEKMAIYAQVSIGKQVLETPVWKEKGDAKWNSKFAFSFRNANALNIQLRDWKVIKKDNALGSVSVSLIDIPDNEKIDKVYPIKGGKGSLHVSLKITRFSNINNILPVECEVDDDNDEWSKQNVQPLEMFIDECQPRGVFDNKNKDGYHFEQSFEDLTTVINEEVPVFNVNYFEHPISDQIFNSENKMIFYNDVETPKGPILIAIGDPVGGLYKAVIISQLGRVKTYIRNIKDVDYEICNVFGLKMEEVKMKEAKSNDIWKSVLDFEQRCRLPCYKIGLVYAKEQQKTEQEFLSNKTSSPLFDEFVNVIGETVKLEGFTKYRGGLDIKSNTTGTTSVATSFNDIDIMFHVSTMLQHVDSDPQHLDKKRHIGNDVCVLIFKESKFKRDDEIDLTSFVSQFNHVFIVVSPVVVKGEKLYRVSVACKSAVQGFLPRFPEAKYFPRDQQFREWLLLKLINGERAALESPQFIKSQRVAQKRIT
ncbi:Rap GTPase-activating protein [Entamoeba marina]